MKKNYLKLLSVALMLGTTLTGCGTATKDSSAVAGAHHKIGVMLYKASGDDVDALKAYLDSIDDDLNIEFVLESGSAGDASGNLTKTRNLIQSGVEAIITSLTDNGFPSYVEACAEAEIPIASYYGTPEDYYYSGKGAADAESMAWYLGGVEDGVRSGDNGGAWLGTNAIENVVAAGHRNIGLVHFNFTYYPKHAVACDTIIKYVNDWNTKHQDDQITLTGCTLVDETAAVKQYKTVSDFPGKYPGDYSNANTTGNLGEQLGFSAIADTYFQAGGNGYGVDAVLCTGAAAAFIYPTAVSTGVNRSVKIYGFGYDSSDGITGNFGSAGDKCLQQFGFSNVEQIVYPLVLTLNKLNGKEYTDQYVQKGTTNLYLDTDNTDKRVSTVYNLIQTDADLANLKAYCMYSTKNPEHALIKADEIKKLCLEYNASATYDDLLKAVQSLSLANCVAKNKK